MNDTWFKVKQIGALVLFVLVASLIGTITKNPIMILAYGIFFALVTLGVLMMLKNRQRHFEVSTKSNRPTMKIVGAAMGILALALPLIVALSSSFIPLPDGSGAMAYAIIGGLTVLFIALNIGAVYMINFMNGSVTTKIVGYLLVAIAAIIPGAVVAGYDKTTIGIGSVYYIALAVLVLAFNSFTMLYKAE